MVKISFLEALSHIMSESLLPASAKITFILS